MSNRLETEEEAKERPWLQSNRKGTRVCPAVCLSCRQNAANPTGESMFPSQHWLPAHAGGATLVSAAGERKWARVLARAQAPFRPESVAGIASGCA